jgi:DNA-binding transcriptional LysR family regulator
VSSPQYLPSIKSLVAFQIVMQHRSFTRAAETLGLSQSGVSRQIAKLETHVGTALFTREGSSVELTPAGEEYAARVNRAMDAIQTLGETSGVWIGRDRVTLACSQGVARLWLMPRLSALRDAFPDLEIKLQIYESFTRLRSDEYDLAISFHDVEPDLKILGSLGFEDVVPVMAPQLPPLAQQTAPVILTMQGSLRDWTDWSDWLNAAELTLPDTSIRWQLGSYDLCIDAARSGLGVAMGWSWLLHEDLEAGRLVRAHPRHFRGAGRYFLSLSGHRNQRQISRSVGQWLLESNRTDSHEKSA